MSNKIKSLSVPFALFFLTGCFGETGNGGITGTGYTVHGAAQKGPFLIGSTVDVSRLDSAGSPIEGSLTTETTDSLGSFSFSMNQAGAVHIKVDGYHFNELTGQLSDERLTLNAIAAVEEASDSDSQTINVNMLTHLISPRIRALMAEGKSVQQATKQAQQEWFEAFASLANIENVFKFSVLNLYQEDGTQALGNNYLLFITSVFYQYSIEGSDSTLTSVLNSTADDFGDNGIIDSETLLDELTFYATQLNADLIQQNLESLSLQVKGESQTAADISSFLTQMIITSPADNSYVSNDTIINVAGVKKGLGIQYSLMVDGVEAQALAEEESSFNWQPYFWSSHADSRHTLLVKASLNGTDAYSNLINVTVKSSLNQQLELVSPMDNETIRSKKTALLKWKPLPSASHYEVELYNSERLISTQTVDQPNLETTSLNKGLYLWRLRAINASTKKGSWSDARSFSINGPEAVDTLELSGQMQYIKDNAANLSLLWPVVPQASGYRIEVSRDENFYYTIENIITDKNQLALNLEEGEYFWRATVIDSLGLEGNSSEPGYIVITGPEAPIQLETVVGNNVDGLYNVDFSWAAAENAEKYQIEVAIDEVFTEIVTTEYSSYAEISLELAANNYYWRVTAEDIHELQGEPTPSLPIEVGVFKKYLGGSNDDKAKKIISTKDGGYIILAYSKSYEVSDFIDSQGDDWIIKIDQLGNIEWDYISNSAGRSRFNDIVEISDGSIIMVGHDSSSQQAVALNLDKDGKSVWEILYRPNDISNQYDFTKAVEFNNYLYVLGVEKEYVSGRSTQANRYLHTVSLEDGGISDPIDIPRLPNMSHDYLLDMEATSTGDLLLAGYAQPENGNYGDWEGGAYLQVLDSDLTQVITWNNVGGYTHGGFSDAIELPNGNFALIGMSLVGPDDAISVINPDGFELSSYQGDSNWWSMMGESIVGSESGEIYLLLQDFGYETSRLMCMVYSPDLSESSPYYLLDFIKPFQPEGLLKNKDETFTLLVNEAQSGYDNYDIIINKRKMD